MKSIGHMQKSNMNKLCLKELKKEQKLKPFALFVL